MTLHLMLARLAALSLALASLAFPAQAQVLRVPGEPALAPKAAPQPQIRLAPARAAAARAELPPVSEEEVESVRRANRAEGKGRLRERDRRIVVGVVRSAEAPRALPSSEQLQWREVEGGHAAQLSVTSPEAGALRLAFALAGVPGDVEMVFFGNARERLEGPVRVADIADRTRAWWSPLTEGDTQTVEIFVPRGHDAEALALRVVDASHVFTTPSSNFTKRIQDIGEAGACNVDLPCSPLNAGAAFQSLSRSVAQMVFIDGSFTTLCTGTLLADGNAATQTPWFYSANHCFENEEPPYKTPAQMQAVASTLTTLWGFESTACGASSLSSGFTQVGGGSALIYNNPQNDVLFLRLNAAVPSTAFFSGWDATPVSVGAGVVAVHHPMGDLKKASQGSITGFEAPGVGGGLQSFIRVQWSSGTTEIGSSGGGLWVANGGHYYLRGALFGGFAGCGNLTGADYYSRLDQVYPALSAYLGSATGPTSNYTDLWWNPNESGWGLNLVQHATNVVFGVWYTYAADGKRTWFTIPTGNWTSRTTYTGPLFTVAGPPYTGAFDPNQVQTRQVGTATLTFSSPDSGTFAYSVDGVSGTKSITRQPF